MLSQYVCVDERVCMYIHVVGCMDVQQEMCTDKNYLLYMYISCVCRYIPNPGSVGEAEGSHSGRRQENPR